MAEGFRLWVDAGVRRRRDVEALAEAGVGGLVVGLETVAGPDVLGEARKQPELNPQALFSSFSTSTPQFNYDLDRTKAKLLGLSLPDVFNTLQIYLGSLYVNDFNLFGRTYRVMMQAAAPFRSSVNDVSRFYVRSAQGRMVPLNTLTTTHMTTGPDAVARFNVYEAIEINGSAAPGYSSGQAIAAMEQIGSSLPAGCWS